MKEYIPKSALVAEIDVIVKALNRQNPDPLGNHTQCLAAAEIEALNLVKDIIDTLETKEIDLEKEIKNYLDKQPIVARSQGIDYKLVPSPETIAKHFFELGLKARKESKL